MAASRQFNRSIHCKSRRSQLPTCAPWLLLKMQPDVVREPSSMVIAPVWRPLFVVKLLSVIVKKEPKPWITPSGVPARCNTMLCDFVSLIPPNALYEP